MEQSKTDILITSYFRKGFTEECLESIYQSTPEDSYRIIVVDNGSSQETADMLWDYFDKQVINDLILLDDNRGLEPAKNIGLTLVKSDWFIDMDNDIFVNKHWLEQLIELKNKYPDFAAISAHPQIFIGDDINFLLKGQDEVREYSHCGASARIMDTKLVRKVGGWRNEGDMTTLTRGEEHYICGKLRAEGKKVGYARDVAVHHAFGDENWGYEKDVEHYHRPIWPMPTDKIYGKGTH